MNQFILIDHSTKGYGGHHYEYAVHVLNAARDRGFEPLLVAHQDFRVDPRMNTGWRIVPAYRYGFWQAPAASGRPWWRRVRDAVYPAWIRIKYSRVGMYLSLLPAFIHDYTPRGIIADARSRWRMMLMLGLLGGVRYPVRVGRAVVLLLGTILAPLGGYGRRVWEQLYLLIKELLYPGRVLLHLPRMAAKRQEMRFQKAFGEDTARLFAQVPLREGDVVFIPTLSARDMLGLLDYFRQCPEARRASWHLLFRRNIFSGTEAEYPRQNDEVALLKRAFEQFTQGAASQRVFFYTDTARLTEQYNRLGVVRFRTLPIPVNPEFFRGASPSAAEEPLTIVYAGDARQEKGYTLLPGIVHDLLSREETRARVRFEFQSNFAHGRIEDAAEELLARSELLGVDSDRVRLHREPLDSAAYLRLVRDAEILLILYDPRNYYARSSGILIEALAAGVPVVTPAGSWMGQELAEAEYAYCAALRARARVVVTVGAGELTWVGADDVRRRQANGEVTFDGARRPANAFVARPAEATHVLISFDRPRDPGAHTLIWVSHCRRKGLHRLSPRELNRLQAEERFCYEDEHVSERLLSPNPHCAQCACLVRLAEGADTLWLSLRHAYAQHQSVTLENFELTFLADPAGALREEVVGSRYVHERDIPECVRRVVLDYDWYRRTAQEHARTVSSRHSAQRLVEELVA